MHVVRNAADFQGAHFILPRDAAEKWPKTFSQWRGDERATFFGAEDAMVIMNSRRTCGISAVLSGLVTLQIETGVETPGYFRAFPLGLGKSSRVKAFLNSELEKSTSVP